MTYCRKKIVWVRKKNIKIEGELRHLAPAQFEHCLELGPYIPVPVVSVLQMYNIVYTCIKYREKPTREHR